MKYREYTLAIDLPFTQDLLADGDVVMRVDAAHVVGVVGGESLDEEIAFGHQLGSSSFSIKRPIQLNLFPVTASAVLGWFSVFTVGFAALHPRLYTAAPSGLGAGPTIKNFAPFVAKNALFSLRLCVSAREKPNHGRGQATRDQRQAWRIAQL